MHQILSGFGLNLKFYWSLFILLGIMIIVMYKDWLHASVMEYSYYWNESMLFSTFWLLFVPIIAISTKKTNLFNQVLTVIVFPLFATLVHTFIFSLLVYFLSEFFFDHTYTFTSVFGKAIFGNSFPGLLIYSAIAYILHQSQKEIKLSPQNKSIIVKHQDKNLLIPCDSVLYIKTDRPYIAIFTLDHKYLLNDTLKGFQEKYYSEKFVQIHKSTIINIDFIKSFQSRKNGDYDIWLTNDKNLRVSRNYNSYFKLFSKKTT